MSDETVDTLKAQLDALAAQVVELNKQLESQVAGANRLNEVTRHLSEEIGVIQDAVQVDDGQLTLNDGNRLVHGVSMMGDLTVEGSIIGSGDRQIISAPIVELQANDLILNGRSGRESLFRAMVDMGDQLVLNFNGDYTKGVVIGSGLVLSGPLKPANEDWQIIQARVVEIQGSDLILNGRSGTGALFRALVDGGGELVVNFNGDYANGVRVDSDLNVGGVVRSAGGDCAEQFDLAAGTIVEPGMVMVIGPDGGLIPCDQAEDVRVAGIVSGAGDYKPAIILNERAGHRVTIALAGTVACMCDANGAPIVPGDLLTTSSTPGHARKASPAQAQAGAIIGKALGRLAGGTGLVPVIVAGR
jgi:hypothetical protein